MARQKDGTDSITSTPDTGGYEQITGTFQKRSRAIIRFKGQMTGMCHYHSQMHQLCQQSASILYWD